MKRTKNKTGSNDKASVSEQDRARVAETLIPYMRTRGLLTEQDQNREEILFDVKYVKDVFNSVALNDLASTWEGVYRALAKACMIVAAIRGMDLLNSPQTRFTYDETSNELSMPKEWSGIKHKVDGEEYLDSGSAFQPSKNTAPTQAIRSIFDPPSAEEAKRFPLECSTAICAIMYFGVEAAYDLLSGGDQNNFDESRTGQGMILGPLLITQVMLDNELKSVNWSTFTEDLTIDGTNELQTGDLVYFVNYEDYDDTHGENAPWAGEHAIYLGEDFYSGFGVAKLSYKAMINKLISGYNDFNGSKKKGIQEKKVREDEGDMDPKLTVDAKRPGLDKHIKRMKVPDEINDLILDAIKERAHGAA